MEEEVKITMVNQETLNQLLASTELLSRVPPGVKAASNAGELHKVAARLLGCADFDIEAALTTLGRKLYTKRAEWRTVRNGLAALKTTEG
jgi:hypothetical protein